MIIELTSGIRSFDEDQKNRLSKLVMEAISRGHFFEMSFQENLWFQKEFLENDRYYGSLDRELMREAVQIWSPTALMSRSLSTIKIGEDPERDLSALDAVVHQQSIVVVENGKYDWSAISRWVELYCKNRGFEDINSLVCEEIACRRLMQANAGGKGGIVNEATSHVPDFNGAHPVKMMSIFDSDKSSCDDADHNGYIKSGLDGLGVGWYELRKRALENYFDWKCFVEIGCVTGERPNDVDEADWDYLDIEEYINETLDTALRKNKYEKSKMTDLSEKLDIKLLNRRITHDGQVSDEIQDIILRLAKIV